ncbi:KLD10-like protein [Mya arenaria]|uniref:Kelch domain-containing protein 10 n=1 Tax=Mya arenaria TaxID=6604 RepID=A0ABY7FYZ6_MYAAR|nr:KLD10-like protein [Mya arenaria]
MLKNATRPTCFHTQSESNDLIIPRSGHRVLVDSQFLYSWGGFNSDLWDVENDEHTRFPLLKEMLQYEMVTDTWRKLEMEGEFPTGLASHVVFKLHRHILHTGGSGVPFGGSNSNAIYDFNLDTLQWKCIVQEQDLSEEKEAAAPKYGQALAQIDNYMYIVGGTSGFTYDMDINRLNLTDLTWEHLEPRSKYVPSERYRHEVVHYEGNLYLFGGGTAGIEYQLKEIDVFHIEMRVWEKAPTVPYQDIDGGKSLYPAGRKCHSCHLLADSVYVIGGLGGGRIQQKIWRLHLPSLQWTKLDFSLPKPDGCLFVFGGVTKIDTERTNDLQCVWLAIPSLRTMSWSVVWSCLDKTRLAETRSRLLQLGVPADLLQSR